MLGILDTSNIYSLYQQLTIESTLNYSITMSDPSCELCNKILGAVVGHACGDYLGMPVEFKSKPEQVVDFFGELGIRPLTVLARGHKTAGFYTDDTAMMLCLAQSLIDKGFDTRDQFEKYKSWAFNGYMSADNKQSYGIGQNTLRKLLRQGVDNIPTKIENNNKEGGNGALMRCLPIGIVYFQEIDQVVEKSVLSALVTHNNDIAVWSTVVFNTFVSYSLKGLNKDAFLDRFFAEHFYRDLPEDIKTLLQKLQVRNEQDISNTGYSLNTLEIALVSFFSTDQLDDAIKMAIGFAGDTDTQGAVTGGLAGAYYGYNSIPNNWVESLQNREMIINIAQNLCAISSKKN